MSRRKQSNPKPFKRLSDDEDDDADMKSTESNKPETDAISSDPDLNDQSTHSTSVIKSEPTSPKVHNNDEEESNPDEKPPVIFLNDVLLLKKVEKDEAHQMGRSFLVCAAIPLPKGSSIGPFDAEIVSLSSIRQGDLVLQAQDEHGETSFVRVEDPDGTWLTMLRPAPSESVRNASVFYKGGQIWCEIISELNFGTELLSSFTIQEAPKSEPCSPDSTDLKEKEDDFDMELKPEVTISPSLEPTSPVANNNVINHAALLYGCPFCGVRFSSARTLEGHLTYYCSKKPSNAERELARQEESEKSNLEKTNKLAESEKRENEESEKSNNDSNEEHSETETSETKMLQNDELFHCPFCSYTSDKLSSLNRHKRIHARGSNSPTSSTSSDSPVSKQDSYCADCNIQFSSFSTFKCHKEYYCSKRLERIGIRSPENEIRPSASKEFPIAFPEQMSPVVAKNLKHIMNVSSSSLMSGQANVILGPPIVARGMLNMPFGIPTVIVQPVVPPSPAPISPETPSKTKSNIDGLTDQPLDLSISKKDKNTDDSDKENSPKSIISPRRASARIEDRSSSTSSPIESPRQRDRPTSVHSGEKTPSPIPTNRISPFITVPPVQYISGKPIPPVPHSVSKCMDCNIVFYKHENYVIHKKHYCSSRQTGPESRDHVDDESKDSTDTALSKKRHAIPVEGGEQLSIVSINVKSDNSRSSPKQEEERIIREIPKEDTPESIKTSRTSSPDQEPTPQFFCGPCNIRFSSTSTLNAHKQFYCPFMRSSTKQPTETSSDDNKSEKINNDEIAVSCPQCNAMFPSVKIMKLHYCTGVATHVPLLRCPYCDYVTQTENRISEHLKVHMPSKAYRCTICGYRGNTVRGMRMHGKMHIDNGEEFSDEHMVEIEEPPLVPILFNNPNESSSTNIEAELIRLKNEPYKRRRSRKSYEKSEHMINVREPTPTKVCVFCGQPFNDNASLAMHMRIHEMVAYHAASSRNLKCHFCNHVAEQFPNLMVHIEQKHLKDIDVNSDALEQTSSNNVSLKRSVSDSENELTSPKHPRLDADVKSRETGNDITDDNSSSSSAQDDERERTLNLLNLSCKIKKEPKEIEEESIETKDSLNNNSHILKRKLMPMESLEKPGQQRECTPEKKPLNNVIKLEKSEVPEKSPQPLRSPILSPEIARYYQLAMQVMPPLIIPRVPSRSLPSPTERSEKTSAKYCKYCDISFTYLSTYVAHKKYYCTARQPEELTSPTKA